MFKQRIPPDLLVAAIVALIVILCSYLEPPPMERLEKKIYDVAMRLNPTLPSAENRIVIIEIDDKSLKKLGAWPWPRHRIADLIDILCEKGAAHIGIYLPFAYPMRNQGLEEIRIFQEKINVHPLAKKSGAFRAWLEEQIREMAFRLDGDRRLIESARQGGNIILPAFGYPHLSSVKGSKKTEASVTKNFIRSEGLSASFQEKMTLKAISPPFSSLASVVSGIGHGRLTLKKHDGRGHPPFLLYNGSLMPSFPLRVTMAYLGKEPKKVIGREEKIQLKGVKIPIVKGEMRIKFRTSRGDFPHYSAADLLVGKKSPKSLKGKIALVGLVVGEGRWIDTPMSSKTGEADFIAQIMDSILNQQFIKRPSTMGHIEAAVLAILTLVIAFLFNRSGHLKRGIWLLLFSLLIFATGLCMFRFLDVWLKTSYIILSVLTVSLVLWIKESIWGGGLTSESIEANKMLGLSFQRQGLLDLAFDKFRNLPLDDEIRGLTYDLGLEYEKKGMIDKALSVFQYIHRAGDFLDVSERIRNLQASAPGPVSQEEEAPDILLERAEGVSKIGRYEIMGELGKGSMGLVYKAMDPKIHRLLAIKTIRFSDEFDEDVLQHIKDRFLREAEIAGKLSHPSIVTIHDFGEDRDLTYMAMEYLEGKDLEKYISKNNLLPLNRVLDAVARVADALSYAHDMGVIHRDIKPANIMLLDNGEVKVTDFGIAKAISSSRTRTGVVLGTPNYMSPEQIMGQKIDHRSDIFSLGVLFYQLLSGELPFYGDNLSNLLYRITQEKHTPVQDHNPKIPKACGQIIDKALEKNPNERFKNAGEMAKIVTVLASKIEQLRKTKFH